MAELKPCPVCKARLKQKRTVRGETVFDHPKNGCVDQWTRVRYYKECVEAWNRRAVDGNG